VKTAPDKCPFCESPIMVHGGNLLRSEDGGFATYECKTEQDVGWPDDQWKRTGQKERCRRREVQLLTKQRDEAHERIKRLEEALNELHSDESRWLNSNGELERRIKRLEAAGDAMAKDFAHFWTDRNSVRDWPKAKEAKP
jgi:hypothetical protein